MKKMKKRTLEVYKWSDGNYRHVRTIPLKLSDSSGEFKDRIGFSGLGVLHGDLFSQVELSYLGFGADGKSIVAYITSGKPKK